MNNFKRTIILILSLLLLANLFACGPGFEPKIEPTPPPRDISGDTSLYNSIIYANQMANGVQGFFTNPDRSSYTMVNRDMEIVHELKEENKKFISSLKTRDGKEYLKEGMDLFIEDRASNFYYASDSLVAGRMNTTRFGLYYYESHIRDLGFAKGSFDTSTNSLDISNFSQSHWQKNDDIEEVTFKDEKMEIEIASGYDPYIIQRGLNIKSIDYTGIEIRLKTDGKAGVGEIYFTTSDNPGFSADKKASFSLKDNGKYNNYYIDLAETGKFTGNLTGIRLDVGFEKGEKISFESVKLVKIDNAIIPVKLDKTFHIYSDKVHQEFRIVTTSGYSSLKSFGYEVKLEKKKVDKIQIKDKDGEKNDITAIDGPSLEYAAFDIKNVGILAFIIPHGGLTDYCTVYEEGDYYVFRQYAKVESHELKKWEDLSFGNRLYTDEKHDFSGVAYASTIERNPLNKVNIKDDNSRAKFVAYNPIVGAYEFSMTSIDFNTAYYKEADKHYFANIEVEGDVYDRDFYVWMTSKSGCLESAALLDETQTQMPIPMQVCKNFGHEKEEPIYDPGDVTYGDTFFPMRIKGQEKIEFTLLNLYQNWGNYPLKQVSSIQFHISYYHLSTGVTESNCIAPYFVYAKDGWTLPDFRGASGIMWTGQPQFNSVGRLYFLSYLDGNKKYLSEYTDSYIRSAQNTYVDLDYNYISDEGSYKYSLRHVEFPQLDENRVYYSLDLEFLKNLTINDVKNDFSLFSFDGRFKYFTKTGYLNEKNELSVDTIDVSKVNRVSYVLGKEHPYFSYFDLVDGSEIMNFAFLLIDSDITIGGKKFNGNFIYNNYFDGRLNNASLSLNLAKTKFKKGDKIKLDFILLPFGSHLTKDDESLRTVREDSALKPLSLEPIKGELVEDTFIPRILAIDNEAEFSITGGRNNNTVRVDGFTNIKRPQIFELVDGTWQEYIFYVHDYDGYTVHYNEDGTYSFSFVFTQESPEKGKTFKISN